MELTIRCPHCSQRLRVSFEASGRMARCPHCDRQFRVAQVETNGEDTVACLLVEQEKDTTPSNPRPADQAPSRRVRTPQIDGASSALRWQAFPLDVRHRLATWFTFQNGEQFIMYLADSDLSPFETGQEGVIVTDQRMLFCHKGRHQNLSLDTKGDLLLVKAPPHYNLIFRDKHSNQKLAQLHHEDAPDLVHALDELKQRLRVTRARES